MPRKGKVVDAFDCMYVTSKCSRSLYNFTQEYNITLPKGTHLYNFAKQVILHCLSPDSIFKHYNDGDDDNWPVIKNFDKYENAEYVIHNSKLWKLLMNYDWEIEVMIKFLEAGNLAD